MFSLREFDHLFTGLPSWGLHFVFFTYLNLTLVGFIGYDENDSLYNYTNSLLSACLFLSAPLCVHLPLMLSLCCLFSEGNFAMISF